MQIQAKLSQETLLRMVRWMRWHCPPDTGFEFKILEVWGWARYPSGTGAPHNTEFHEWMGKKHFCFFQAAETRKRAPNSSVGGSGASHYSRAPAHQRYGAEQDDGNQQKISNEKITTTNKPTAIMNTASLSKPTATRKPTALREPIAIRKQTVIRKLTATRKPIAIKKPTATREPIARRKPTTTRTPMTTRQPTAIKKPITTTMRKTSLHQWGKTL